MTAVQTLQPRIGHPMLKGFGYSMLFTVAYGYLALNLFVGGAATIFLFMFFPVFALVNTVVALNYHKKHLAGVKRYVEGAAIALVLDVVLVGGLLYIIILILALGSGGM